MQAPGLDPECAAAVQEAAKSADTRALEKRIEEALGLKAELKLRGLGEHSLLTLEIRDFDQLDAVVDRLLEHIAVLQGQTELLRQHLDDRPWQAYATLALQPAVLKLASLEGGMNLGLERRLSALEEQAPAVETKPEADLEEPWGPSVQNSFFLKAK